MKNIILLAGLCTLFLFSCTTDDNPRGNKVDIRVENVSPYDFENVVVNPNGEAHNYGDINSSQTSDYKTFELAYHYAFVELQIGGDTFTIQPIDFVGETPLKKGEYTYQIDASDSNSQYGRLSLTLVED